MRHTAVPGTARTIPVIGQGTWGLGLSPEHRTRDVDALRLGISLGMALIDTAEFYSGGRAEEVVGEAVADCRDRVFLVAKVWPSHAGYRDVLASVRGSLRRMRTDRVDAALLHWPTRSVPLAETFRAFAELQAAGAIGCFGVSNFSLPWLRLAEAAAGRGAGPGSGARPVFNQVPYSLRNRRVEHEVLPHARDNGQLLMAYSPLGHGRMVGWPGYATLAAVATERGATPQQVALAFLASRPGVVAIPKAVTPEHVRANAAAGDLELGAAEVTRLEAAFPRQPGSVLPILPPYTPFFRMVQWVTRVSGRG